MSKKLYEMQANDVVSQPMDGASPFNPAGVYAVDAVVGYDNSIYVCHKATVPGILPTNTEYWNDITSVNKRFSRDNVLLMHTVSLDKAAELAGVEDLSNATFKQVITMLGGTVE